MVPDLMYRASISLLRVSEHLALPKVSVEDSAAATELPRDECHETRVVATDSTCQAAASPPHVSAPLL